MTPNQPANLLMELVLNLLTPFLIAAGLTDPTLARRTAEETIAAYKAASPDQILTVARIVTFALTAIDNLRLSLPEDLSLSMKLKLRSNASALNRASQKAAATLETTNPPNSPTWRLPNAASNSPASAHCRTPPGPSAAAKPHPSKPACSAPRRYNTTSEHQV